MNDPRYTISPERRAGFFVGTGLSIVGFILFLSTFVSGAMNFGDFTDFESRTRSMAMRAIIGMVMIMVGGVIAGISRMGVAGSGLTMDPQGMRKDLEPWNRAAGGMLGDALDEAQIGKHIGQGLSQGLTQPTKEIIKVRCPGCGALNGEKAKFCDQCGAQMRAG